MEAFGAAGTRAMEEELLMIVNDSKNTSGEQRVLKALVLIVSCFNLLGFFLLFYPQLPTNSTEIESISAN